MTEPLDVDSKGCGNDPEFCQCREGPTMTDPVNIDRLETTALDALDLHGTVRQAIAVAAVRELAAHARKKRKALRQRDDGRRNAKS